LQESAIPAYITSLIRHFGDLRDGTHGGSASRKDKEAHFEKAVQLLAPIARQMLRNEYELAARHRRAHRDGTAAHSGWRARRILGFELARTAGSRDPANHATSLFRRRLSPPSSSRSDRSRLAAERVQRRGCRGPAIRTAGHRLQRSAQFGLSRGLPDRPSGHSTFFTSPARGRKTT